VEENPETRKLNDHPSPVETFDRILFSTGFHEVLSEYIASRFMVVFIQISIASLVSLSQYLLIQKRTFVSSQLMAW
jgi:hypothetical protein